MWADILKQIASTPELANSVNPPARLDDISALSRRLGVPLPSSFTDYLSTMDGQNDAGNLSWILEYNRFLPVAEILQHMTAMEELFGDEGPLEHICENKIRPVLWDRRWVPFSEFEGTPRLILDLHPGRRGVRGQILLLFPGVDLEDDNTVVAPSFAAFAADLLRALRERP